ncbi:MAG: hypothetical protein MHMPM18_002764 [Marteilia pararefringens]
MAPSANLLGNSRASNFIQAVTRRGFHLRKKRAVKVYHTAETGEELAVPEVTDRFLRLSTNCFIHKVPETWRRGHATPIKYSGDAREERRKHLAAHNAYPQGRAKVLERMVGPWERREHFFLQDDYAPYRKRFGNQARYEKPECLP